MDYDWARLGELVRAERKRIGLSQIEFAAAAGLGRSTVQAIERGEERDEIGPPHRAIEKVLGWAPRSIDAILAGGEPVAASDETPSQSPASERLPWKIVRELDGPLLDATVTTLPTESGGRIVSVVVGPPGASKEQLDRDLLAGMAMIRRMVAKEAEEAAGGE